jgi:hypothetical protein
MQTGWFVYGSKIDNFTIELTSFLSAVVFCCYSAFSFFLKKEKSNIILLISGIITYYLVINTIEAQSLGRICCAV